MLTSYFELVVIRENDRSENEKGPGGGLSSPGVNGPKGGRLAR